MNEGVRLVLISDAICDLGPEVVCMRADSIAAVELDRHHRGQ
jgi:hypothetical protein